MSFSGMNMDEFLCKSILKQPENSFEIKFHVVVANIFGIIRIQSDLHIFFKWGRKKASTLGCVSCCELRVFLNLEPNC